MADRPWHVIHGDTLLRMLERCYAGENPEMVYVEEYANAERHANPTPNEQFVPVENPDGSRLYLTIEDGTPDDEAVRWEAEWFKDEHEWYAALPVFMLVPKDDPS